MKKEHLKKEHLKNRHTAAQVLKKLRNRIWTGRILQAVVTALLAAALLSLALVLLAHLIPVVFLYRKCALITVMLAASGLLFGLFRRPSLENAAVQGDKIGLMDRLITYLEYGDREDRIGDRFREELEEALFHLNPLRVYRIPVPGKRLAAVLLCYLTALSLTLVPSFSMEQAWQKEDTHRELRQEGEKLARLREEMAGKNPEEERGQKQEALDLIRDLEKKLKQSFSQEKAAQEVARTLDELEALQKGGNRDQAQTLAGIFHGMEGNAQKIGSLLAAGEIDRALDMAAGESFTSGEREKLRENIDRWEKSGALSAPELTQALHRIQTDLDQGTLDGKKLAQALEPALGKNEGFQLPEQVAVKLEAMKERMLAKGEGGVQGAGQDKAEDFARGENAGLESGEITSQNPDQLALGGAGTDPARNPEGRGGGSSGDDASGGEAWKGTVERDSAGAPDASGTQTSVIQGRWQEGGQVQEKSGSDTLAVTGEVRNGTGLNRDFGTATLEYTGKEQVPAKYRNLVEEYFNKLDGGI